MISVGIGSRGLFIIFITRQATTRFEEFIVLPRSVFLVFNTLPDISRPPSTYVQSKEMPPHKKPASSINVMRPGRIAKERARAVIKAAIPKTKSHTPKRTRAVSPPAPSPSPSPTVLSTETPEREMSGEPSEYSRVSHRPRITFMDEMERRTRNLITEMFAIRDEKEKAEKIATASAIRGTLVEEVIEAGINSPLPPVLSRVPMLAPHNVLARWPWVDKDTVELIANGQFDIDGLPKLHRTDSLRNAYLKKSLKGIYQPLEGGPSEIIVGTTKLQSAFKESTTFFLAWHIYMSIRTTYQPERGSGLVDWTSRLFYFLHLNYAWPAILEYIIAYYQRYQNAPANDWFNSDPTLISYHLSLSQQKPAPAMASRNVGKSKFGTGQKPSLSTDEICLMYNRATGCIWQEKRGEPCPHRHVCSICTLSHHNALSCPKKSK